MNRFTLVALGAIACAWPNLNAFAHGFAGKRFFPATLATEDPFVADELSMPTLTRRNVGMGEDGASEVESSASIDYTKRITQDLGFSLGASYLRQQDGSGVQHGFDNLGAGLKYQFYKSEPHESIASFGVDWDIGGTGTKRVGAEDFSTLTPSIFFGKGLGELPEGARWLRPLAVTGSVGLAIPTRTLTIDEDGNDSAERNPDSLHVGLAIEYSIPYLQSFVKDIGLREPFNRLVPLVEFDLEKPVNRGSGPWTGTVNPGLLWPGRYVQLGIEAVVPVNSRTGGKTGVLLQLHFFLDDLFPHGIGKPLL